MRPNSKMSASRRKKSRFSGKNRPNRVRFTCRSSTSVAEKSVLIVSDALSDGVNRYAMSSDGSKSVSEDSRVELTVARDAGRGNDLQADALIETFETRREARARRIERLVARHPGDVFVLARHAAREIDAPGVGVRIEGDRRERNRAFRRPSRRRNAPRPRRRCRPRPDRTPTRSGTARPDARRWR